MNHHLAYEPAISSNGGDICCLDPGNRPHNLNTELLVGFRVDLEVLEHSDYVIDIVVSFGRDLGLREVEATVAFESTPGYETGFNAALGQSVLHVAYAHGAFDVAYHEGEVDLLLA